MGQADKFAEDCAGECCAPPPLVLPTTNEAGSRANQCHDGFGCHPSDRQPFKTECVSNKRCAWHWRVLVAFGLDSVIELISAGVLMWRLSTELRHGQAFSEAAERLASWICGVLLFALARYVVLGAGWNLWDRRGQEFSFSGLVLTILAIPFMRYLARQKIDLADKLGSRALRTDAVESITCGWLSLVALGSLAARAVLGFWWIDSVGSLAILWLLVKEGREAWSGGCYADC
jgi:hypothetical protein